MKPNASTCDPQRIALFLEQKLSNADQEAFESHLDVCDDCCRRLEATAAPQEVWTGVREFLRNRKVSLDDVPASDADPTAEDASSNQATILKLLAPTDDDRMIGRWGTYEVVGVVGTGGMGVVLKAFDAALNRYVAIKILAPHLGSSGAARRRFSREAQASAAVVHDNVIEIYGVAEAAEVPYLVMPYVRGPSLQRRLDDEGPLALAEILRVAMQAAAGLAAAHAQGLVHRDVKPANILLADGIERVKLTDFGLARAADDASLTRTGIIAGTPQYMSPEQARGEPVDQRSDLFSLGSVLYATCTGRPPFRAETTYGVLRRITDDEPRPIREINPEIPEWLCGIVAKLMAKLPDDRFRSASEVSALLEQCLAHVQQPTSVPLPNVLISLRRDECITAERDEYDAGQPSCSPLPPGEGQRVKVAAGAHKPRSFAGWSGRTRIVAAAIGLLFFGALGLALGILIHLKKDGKTTTIEVPEESIAHVDPQGAVTVDLPSSSAPAAKIVVETTKTATARTTIEPLDVLNIRAANVPPDEPLDGYYGVEPDGNVSLGPEYGRVQVRGLTVEAAEKTIERKLQDVLKEPKVQVTFALMNPPWHEAAVPRQPYTIGPFDVLGISVPGAPQDQPIDNYFLVEPEGTVPLGPEYGRVQLKGLTLEEAQRAIDKKLQAVLTEPNAGVTLACGVRTAAAPRAPYTIKPNDLLYITAAGAPSEWPIDGVHAVEPSGTVPLAPPYGRVNVQGLSLEAAEKVIEKKLREFLVDPAVSVTVAGWTDPARGLNPGPIAANTPSNPSEVGKLLGTLPKSKNRGTGKSDGQPSRSWAEQTLPEDLRLWQGKKRAEADSKLKQAAEPDPQDANAWNRFGWSEFNAGKGEIAMRAFQKAIQLKPDHAAALNGLGQVYLDQRRYAEAEQILLKAAPQAPAAWVALTRLYLLQGKFEQAEPWAKKVLDSPVGDDVDKTMLKAMFEAAKTKHLSDRLRKMLEPPPAEKASGTSSESGPGKDASTEALAQFENAKTVTWKTTTYTYTPTTERTGKWIRTEEELAYKAPDVYREVRFGPDRQVEWIRITDSTRDFHLIPNTKRACLEETAVLHASWGLHGPFVLDADAMRQWQWVASRQTPTGKATIFRAPGGPRWSVDYWIDQNSKRIVREQIPGTNIYDPENDPRHDNPVGRSENWPNGAAVSTIAYDIVYDAPVDDSLFSFRPPAGYKVTVQQRNYQTEGEMIDYFRILAELNGGFFPARRYPDQPDRFEFDQPDLGALNRKPAAQRTAAEKEFLKAVDRMIASKLNCGPIYHFITDNAVKGSFVYVGKGVKLGDKGAIVCWYKLKNAKNARTYRAVYGNLSVNDVRASDLPLPVQPAPSASADKAGRPAASTSGDDRR